MKKHIPIWIKDYIKNRVNVIRKNTKNIICPICQNKSSNFEMISVDLLKKLDENQFVHSIFQFETLNWENYHCSVCSASDRARLYAIYLNNFLQDKENDRELNFLDIAPDLSLANFIRTKQFINYCSMDLHRQDVDYNVDITDMKIFNKESFDIILCSHVLEHISDDRKAMAEIFRVLKPSGFAIIMVPVMLTLNSDLENHEWTSETDRWKYYGQNDHVRMYSKNGFISKLEGTGFKVKQLGINFFGKEIFLKFGIHKRSVLYIVQK